MDLRLIWDGLRTPSEFRRDWYGWLTNQASHTILGVVLALMLSAGWEAWHGEWPWRWQVWCVILIGAMIWERAIQPWRRWDSVEDIAFVAFWGAGVALLSVREDKGELVLHDISTTVSLVTAWALHMIAGALART